MTGVYLHIFVTGFVGVAAKTQEIALSVLAVLHRGCMPLFAGLCHET